VTPLALPLSRTAGEGAERSEAGEGGGNESVVRPLTPTLSPDGGEGVFLGAAPFVHQSQSPIRIVQLQRETGDD
jgi:hypothetical protein